jgi:cellobiose phosphorylase
MPSQLTIPNEAQLGLHTLTNDAGLSISVLPCGTLFAIEHHGMLINQLFGTPLGEGVMRVVVRRRDGDAPGVRAVASLIGAGHTHFAADADRFTWRVERDSVVCTCVLQLADRAAAWVWRVEVDSPTPGEFDAVLIQDVGLASRGQVLNNELYTSQYLDHSPSEHTAYGWTVRTRQNLPQHEGRCPTLTHACLDGAAAYATDGTQLVGCETRDLPSQRLQHEAGWIGLQSRPQSGKAAHWNFVAVLDDTPDAIAGCLRLPGAKTRTIPAIAPSVLRDVPPLTVEPVKPQGDCVVTAAEEATHRRRTGHIIRTSSTTRLDERVMCSTAWMAGVFASQVTLGNTSFHKLFSVARDPLHVIRSGGLRILVKIGDAWRLLAMPSVFEMEFDRCRWCYATRDRTIVVTTTASPDRPRITLDVTVEGEPVELMLLGHIVAGNHEYEAPATVEIDGRRLTVRPDSTSLFGQKYPAATFTITASTAIDVEQPPKSSHIAMRTHAVAAFSLVIEGDLHGQAPAVIPVSDYWPSLLPLSHSASNDRHWPMLAASLPWMAHNAMVHLTTPRGLEQNSGAAWGVRDVCQGPVEFMLAADRPDVVRDILLTVFAQQWSRRHEWPQWFMHPPYENIRDSHSHGDVIIWPLKALCDYLEHTADFGILDEVVPYFDEDRFAPSDECGTVLEHVDRLIARVKSLFIPGTSLIRYGEGDWNDALQPADPKLRDTMVSAWTVALLYHTLRRWAEALRRMGDLRNGEIDDLLAAIHRDFHKHLMCDGVVAGYALFGASGGGQVQRRLLHPTDDTTGIHYSLIPMTRSMLAHLFTPEQAQQHLAIIREHLLAPDGARLMDRPPTYRGGEMRIFKRAESSSFFGREIGLQYVHAHLRYCEAMALLGEADALYDGLLAVNPMTVTDVVPGAGPRQRNAYFSSSDAAFADRYEADRDYRKVMRGDIRCDGGWRIYSSGPGIYVNIVVRHLLGIRRHYGQLVLDPVLPRRLDGLRVTHRSGLQLTCRAHDRHKQGKINPQVNPYRAAGEATVEKSGVNAL